MEQLLKELLDFLTKKCVAFILKCLGLDFKQLRTVRKTGRLIRGVWTMLPNVSEFTGLTFKNWKRQEIKIYLCVFINHRFSKSQIVIGWIKVVPKSSVTQPTGSSSFSPLILRGIIQMDIWHLGGHLKRDLVGSRWYRMIQLIDSSAFVHFLVRQISLQSGGSTRIVPVVMPRFF